MSRLAPTHAATHTSLHNSNNTSRIDRNTRCVSALATLWIWDGYAVLMNDVLICFCSFVVGTYSARSGQPSCTKTPPGSYQNVTGATSYVPCPIATEQPALGRAQCNPCPPGTASSSTNLANCGPCPPGQYQDKNGNTQQHRNNTEVSVSRDGAAGVG